MIEEAADVTMLERAGVMAFPGFRLLTLAVTTSTQDMVRSAARAGAGEGYCCRAGSQSAGRGRQDRLWTAPPGSALLASVLVRVKHPHLGGVPIAAGLALRAAIAASGCESRVKWPNDLLVEGRKLAGILCEVEPAASGDGTAIAVGFGVNLRVSGFPQGVRGVSLHQLVASPPSAPRLLAALLGELAARLAALDRAGVGALRDEWTRHAAGLGETVMATSSAGTVSGVAEGIDEDGALLVRSRAGTRRVLAGDVHLVDAES